MARILERGVLTAKSAEIAQKKGPDFEQKVTKITKFFQGGQSHARDMCRGMRAVEYARCLASCVKSAD